VRCTVSVLRRLMRSQWRLVLVTKVICTTVAVSGYSCTFSTREIIRTGRTIRPSAFRKLNCCGWSRRRLILDVAVASIHTVVAAATLSTPAGATFVAAIHAMILSWRRRG
jgi:hypothetical protein